MDPRYSNLLPRAFGELNPAIFSHPIWCIYLQRREPRAESLIEELLFEFRNLAATGNWSDCCQILLLCAYLYQYINDTTAAKLILQKTQNLAEQQNLPHMLRCAVWGDNAISFKQGDMHKIIENLDWLRNDFLRTGDWVMSQTIELIQIGFTGNEPDLEPERTARAWMERWGEVCMIQASYLERNLYGNTFPYSFFEDLLNGKISKTVNSLFTQWRQYLSNHLQNLFGRPKYIDEIESLVDLQDFPSRDFEQLGVNEISLQDDLNPRINDIEDFKGNFQDFSSTISDLKGDVINTDQRSDSPPALEIYLLGIFRVYQDNLLISEWPSTKSKAIFKYIISHRSRPISKEVLMDVFWPDAEPNSARNNLNVSIYHLRQALRSVRPDYQHIIFQEDQYLLDPDMSIWIDSEEFMKRFSSGRRLEERGMIKEAIGVYEMACNLYQDDFLIEDPYEEWIIPKKEGLKDVYLIVLDRLCRFYLDQNNLVACIHNCKQILAVDNCREDAHRRLMICYSRTGQPNLALQQYHVCKENLERILDVKPMAETETLYRQIRSRKAV